MGERENPAFRMTSTLDVGVWCGFCQRVFAECEADICPERAIVCAFATLLTLSLKEPRE